MPIIWEKDSSKLGVYVEELVPNWWPSWDALRQALVRAKKRGYGVMRLQRGGGIETEVLIDYDSLDREIQATITDLRKDENYHIMEKWYVEDALTRDFYKTYRIDENDPTSHLKATSQKEYVINASVLKAVKQYKEAHVIELAKLKQKAKKLYQFMTNEAQSFQNALHRITGNNHTLPASERAFRDVYDKFFSEGTINYAAIIHKGLRNNNANKKTDTVQEALLKKMLRHANNLNYEQVRKMYNEVASISDWKLLGRKTIENFAKAHKLEITGGRRGEVAFDNTLAMQHKRRDIAYPMLMWSIDGWDAELLYQKTELNAKGHNVTSYHHRPTIVVVLDPYSRYPIGYAIGTHETPALIRTAIRNAINHTEELFGCRHRPQQVQSDKYGNGALKPFFEAASAKQYTPAKVRNAKTKYVESYFNYINESYCQYLNNWSGHNVTARAENQPNTEWKNKIRHSFPDYTGAVRQLETAIETERNKKRAAYLDGWNNLPDMYRAPINTEQYLYMLGEVKERTSRFRGDGLVFDIAGREFSYDTFDMSFRRYTHIDWQVRYDLESMDTVLACNTEGNIRFLLSEKYQEGATIAERTGDDFEQSRRIDAFNEEMKSLLMQETATEHEEINTLLANPVYNDTLSKMLIIDSMGQHKDQRNAKRIAAPSKAIKEKADNSLKEMRQAYIDKKVNVNDFIQ
jgi:hypothetical protein